MQDDAEIFSEERAAAVWQRAAQLQAEAMRREERERGTAALATTGDPGPRAFSLAEVRTAALQAGIAPEFVSLALVEAQGPDAAAVATASPRRERLATRLLGTPQRSVDVTRRVAAPPATVLDAMKRVLPAAPYHLVLSGVVGDDPLNGAVLVFDIPSYYNSNTMAMPPLTYSGAMLGTRQLRVVLRPVPGAGGAPATEVSAAVDLRRGAHQNATVALVTTGLSGALGAAGGTAVGVGALALGALAVLPAAAGAALLAPAVAAGYGALYRHYVRKIATEMDGLLRNVEAYVRTSGAFAPPLPRPGDGPGGALAGLL